MKKNIFILFILVSTSFISKIEAQENPYLFATVSDDTVLIGNYIELSFTIKNVEGKFEAPSFDDFEIIGGPNVSSSFQFINGESSQEKTYSYYLKPIKEGSLYIPPAYLVMENEGYETTPLKINVLSNPDGLITQPTRKPRQNIFEQWTPQLGNPEFGIPKIEVPEKNSKKPSKWKKRKI